MDPQANMTEQLALARVIVAAAEDEVALVSESDAIELAELVIALHEWRSTGGFDPYADPNAPQVNPQANALLRVLLSRSGTAATVSVGPLAAARAALPERYLYVEFADFDCGIAPDESVSS